MAEVRARVHRILKPMANFFEIHEGAELPEEFRASFVAGSSEIVLGIYVNSPSMSGQDAILFTTEGLYLHRDRLWLQVLYSNIARSIPPISGCEVTGFTVVLLDGTEIWLPVKGSKDGRFYDAFEMVRFIDRVRNDTPS